MWIKCRKMKVLSRIFAKHWILALIAHIHIHHHYSLPRHHLILQYCVIVQDGTLDHHPFLPVKYGGFLLPDVVARNISSLIPAVLHPPPVLAVVDQDQPLVPPHVQLLDQSAVSILQWPIREQYHLVTLRRVVVLGEHELGVLAGTHFDVTFRSKF